MMKIKIEKTLVKHTAHSVRGPVSGWIQFNRVRLTALMFALAAFGSGAAFGAVSAPPLPVTAATDSSDDGHAAANAVDGSLATRWSANGNGQWLRLDLGTSQKIGSVNIAWYEGNKRKSKFDLQTGDDGTNWTTIYTGESSGTTTNYESYPVVTSSGRYLRVMGHGNTSDLWNSISDVQTFGASAAGTLTGLRFIVTPAAPVLNGSLNGSTVTLNWNFKAGTTNQVQVSSNLVSWQNVGAPITNSTAGQTWAEDVSSLSPAAWSARFYRLKPATGSSGTVSTGSPPVASFAASSTLGIAPMAVQFTDQSTGHPSAWSWNFGDSTTSSAQNPSHTYSTAGNFTATLTVTGGGQSSSASHTITVTNASVIAAVTANFSASPSSGQAPLAVQFTDQSTGPVTSRNWTFGDGTTSTAQNPAHTYSASGTYTATLTVQNSAGNSSSKSTTIQVNPQPSGATLPSKVFDMTNWKLTLPTGSSGSPTEITQPSLASYVNPSYFDVNAAGDGVVFTAPCGGVTTSGSGYPRSELREMINNGSTAASWTTTSGIHTMEVTEAITHLPVVKPQAIAGQIHDGVTKVIDCRLEGSQLYMEDASGGTIVILSTNYQLGTKFTFKWVVQNGGIAIYYNGQYITTYSVNGSGCYFKVGDYTQSNTSKGDAPTAYGQVTVYSATVSHQ
jgi:poly(beta-D-mannuronate) lyase